MQRVWVAEPEPERRDEQQDLVWEDVGSLDSREWEAVHGAQALMASEATAKRAAVPVGAFAVQAGERHFRDLLRQSCCLQEHYCHTSRRDERRY